MSDTLLRKVQLTQLEIMIEIDRICKEHNLKYLLFYGTLIGAVRHGGFIPWDDDLDIVMPRDDYEKFLQIAKKELSDTYWLQSLETDPEYWLPFAKIRKIGTLYKEKSQELLPDDKCGIWVDIFPLDRASGKHSLLLKFRHYLIKTIGFSLRKRQLGYSISAFSRRYIPILLFWQLFSKSQIIKLQSSLMKSSNKPKNKFYVSLLSPYHILKEVYPINWLEPVELEFENTILNVPKEFDGCLKQLYGDYMTPPPIEKRGGHNIDQNTEIIV